jgi:hypothetical protein
MDENCLSFYQVTSWKGSLGSEMQLFDESRRENFNANMPSLPSSWWLF